ncbi:MAG: YraN family protein [Bernardetiaceae bacterium]|jgi:putative endonuclease|nr:YraN family protein [Bernardetiaceae bacterium]
MSKKAQGQRGEDLAAVFLQQKGYEILHRNYRYLRGEIDIVARQGQVLVFVEVKTRKSISYGYPEQAVGPGKQHLIKQTAEGFLVEHQHQGDIRFDIVSIVTWPGLEIVHFEDAFF